MLLKLPQILSRAEVQAMRERLADDGLWRDGRISAGPQAQTVKRNEQAAQDHPTVLALQAEVLAAVQRSALFFSAALPRRYYNPLFNRYRPEHPTYGPHIDGAILHSRRTQEWVRTDVSCTLFLSDPDEYDGGELTIHDTYGVQRVKLAAGDAVLYPGTSLHEVTPVTRGARIASFFWIESMVRSDEQRRLLFELDMNLLKLRERLGETAETTALTGVYHNLLRQWADS
ncbi:Fe2+-dependent dioxygenase [Tepidicella xavieri]|jgi:PKHD-type hydroxylase|uniref:PKHD-type hydroxylase n=1 Tax=Tepidicella xavieri TaxID=360241 RepID=A0A4R6UHD5_9BURK|nr:Fe2+-dependent dioxygenase [Tepidicella xavieri]TDQ44709.1 PKHD-type hydroxylase [Tepidicella xavieri]